LDRADGTIIDQDARIHTSDGLQHIVLTMDEAMYDNVTHTGNAVTNRPTTPCVGRRQINGAIVKVDYG